MTSSLVPAAAPLRGNLGSRSSLWLSCGIVCSGLMLWASWTHPAIGILVALVLLCALSSSLIFRETALVGLAPWRQLPRTVRGVALVGISSVVLLAAVAAVIVRGQDSDLQTFAASGLAKRIVLPVAYLVGVWIFLAKSTPSNPRSGLAKVPAQRSSTRQQGQVVFVAALAPIVAAASLLAPLTANGRHVGWSAVLQGVALLSGFLLFFGVGARVAATSAAISPLCQILIVGGFVATLLGEQLSPFATLAVPAGFSLLVLARAQRSRKSVHLILGLGMLAYQLFGLFSSPRPPSIAVLSEYGACAVVLLLALGRQGLRALLGVATAFLAIGAVALTPLRQVVTGAPEGLTDVTLAQRAFEAREAWHQSVLNPLTLLFGGGPGATVDLASSPDAATLLSSGRDLQAVDDIHLLSSYVILKLGILGAAWLAVVLISCLIVISRATSSASSAHIILALFLAAGVVNALPAATNFFSNLIIPLTLGVLLLTPREHQTEGDPQAPPSLA